MAIMLGSTANKTRRQNTQTHSSQLGGGGGWQESQGALSVATCRRCRNDVTPGVLFCKISVYYIYCISFPSFVPSRREQRVSCCTRAPTQRTSLTMGGKGAGGELVAVGSVVRELGRPGRR